MGRHKELVVPAKTLHHRTVDEALLEKLQNKRWHFWWDTQDDGITVFPSTKVRPFCRSHQRDTIRAIERDVIFKAAFWSLKLRGLTLAYRNEVPYWWDATSVKC